MIKRIMSILLAILLISACGSNDTAADKALEQAKLLMRGDILTSADTVLAIEHFMSSAKKGNAEAQYHLGTYYQYGIGVEKDAERALDWYERAAKGGDPKAQNKMGMIFYNGSGADRDYAKARTWFTRSAKRGDDQSQYMLGIMYSRGRGVKPDTAKAIHWLEKSVSGRHPYPEFLLGKLLYGIAETPEEREVAYCWVKSAADKGVGHAKELLEEIEKTGRGELPFARTQASNI